MWSLRLKNQYLKVTKTILLFKPRANEIIRFGNKGVGNTAKERPSKEVNKVTSKQSTPNVPKKQAFLTPSYAHARKYIRGGGTNNCFSENLSLTLLLYYRWRVSCFNPFIIVPNAPFLYPLKTLENHKVFWCFQG